MKNFVRLGSTILLIGILFGLIGVWQHGFKSVFLVDGKPEISTPQMINHDLSSFDKIKINTEDYLVRVKSGSSYHIRVTGMKQSMPKFTVINGTLKLKQTRAIGQDFGFSLDVIDQPTIEITVPSGVTLKRLHSENNSGFSLNRIAADKVVVNSQNSNIKVSDSTLSKGVSIYTGSGNMEISNTKLDQPFLTDDNGNIQLDGVTLIQGTIKSRSGNIEMGSTNFTGLVKITNQSGNITVNDAPKESGYVLRNSDGNNTLFEQHSSEQGLLQQNQDSENRMELTNDNGNNTVW